MSESLQGSVGTGTKEDESNTGRDRAAGFHHVTARSCLARVLKFFEPFISLIFQNFFFRAVVKPRLLNPQIRVPPVYIISYHLMFRCLLHHLQGDHCVTCSRTVCFLHCLQFTMLVTAF